MHDDFKLIVPRSHFIISVQWQRHDAVLQVAVNDVKQHLVFNSITSSKGGFTVPQNRLVTVPTVG